MGQGNAAGSDPGDGALERRSLLRMGLSAAMGVTAAAHGGPALHSAGRRLSAPPEWLRASPMEQPPPERLWLRDTGSPAPPPVAAPLRVNRGARPWTGPAYFVRDVLPEAPANAVALTIDDGPHPVYTPMVLEVLRRYGVKATFSMIGINVQNYPQVARQVVAEGHTVTNHSMWHPSPFTALSPAAIHAEVVDAMNQIWDATRTVPRLFRSPGGEWSPAVFAALAPYDLVPVDWDVDPRDWTVPGVAQIRKVLDTGQGGDILLCHDGGGNRLETVQALSQVLPALLARKLEFVTL